MQPLEGQFAVVTGGGTGVGAAIALALAAAKASTCLVGRRLTPLQAVATSARARGAQAACYQADLASESSQFDLVQRLMRDLPYLDILVQNAAVHVSGRIDCAGLEDFDRQYRTNVRAPYALTKALLPMLKARCGQVVFINSSSGISAKPSTAQYDATKHALRAIADSLRGEVNKYGVRVLSVYIGQTASEMQSNICKKESRPYLPERLLQPKDIAAVVLNSLTLPRTAEVTDIHIRPMINPEAPRLGWKRDLHD